MTSGIETLQEAVERYRTEINPSLSGDLVNEILEIQLEHGKDLITCKRKIDQAILLHLGEIK